MDKNAINIAYKKLISLDYNGTELLVDPYISMQSQISLIDNYVDMIFKPGGGLVSNYIGAEYALILGILDLNTNVIVDTDSKDIDLFVKSGLWDLTRENIKNYREFRTWLDNTCKQFRERVAIERSFNTSFDKLSNSIIGFIDKVSDFDLSEDGIKKLVEAMKTEVDEYKNIVSPEPSKKPRKKAVAKE